jgi:UDP-N-acetylglucosamine/UDP-N-acetylgalactosamine diphosphorylase
LILEFSESHSIINESLVKSRVLSRFLYPAIDMKFRKIEDNLRRVHSTSCRIPPFASIFSGRTFGLVLGGYGRAVIKFDNEGDQILYAKVKKAGQKHIFQFWDDLDSSSRHKLLDQIRSIDFQQFGQLGRLLKDTFHSSQAELTVQSYRPADFIELPQDDAGRKRQQRAARLGEELIAAGKVAAFVVAGGQGTRLGWNAPKGTYPVGPVSRKSLFQIFAEQILAWSQRYKVEIPWFIMCSPGNRESTETFFQQHDFFALPRRTVHFIVQRQLPVVDEHGDMILEARDRIATSPDGHGGALTALEDSGGLELLKRAEIEHLSYFQVDNPLCSVVDPVFLGYHLIEDSEASSKVVAKEDPWERVGVLGYSGETFRVIEYTELDKTNRMLRDDKGRLAFRGGSIANHVFRVDFIERLLRDHQGLPYHLAHKKVATIDEDGERYQPDEANAFKFERFIFDTLSEARSPCSVEVSRASHFEPLKNKEGSNSAETVQRALVEYYALWFEAAGACLERDEKGLSKALCEVSSLTALSKEEFCRKVTQGLSILERDGKLYV